MDAKELRIGNYIQFPSKVVYRIDFLYKNYQMLDYWQPIPLTEKWLIDLGFEVIYSSTFTLRLDHKENFKFGAGWNLVNGHFHVRYIGEALTNIKYVHQLQNLYFALTGEELTLAE